MDDTRYHVGPGRLTVALGESLSGFYLSRLRGGDLLQRTYQWTPQDSYGAVEATASLESGSFSAILTDAVTFLPRAKNVTSNAKDHTHPSLSHYHQHLLYIVLATLMDRLLGSLVLLIERCW